MPLPETIAIRFTEEDAGYVTVRPVVKQTFRLVELADMVVSVTGKSVPRVLQIFRAGTVVYNGYRYWWDGFASGEDEVSGLLAHFPDDDSPPRYEKYSHADRADVFRVHVSSEFAASLKQQILDAAPRALRKKLAALQPPAAIVFFIPRGNALGGASA
jgi:hypothetical protein